MSDVTNHKPNGKRLSALAQLVRLLMRSGLTTTADLVAETGYSERAIWKAKSELRDTEAGCGVQPSALKPSAEWVQRSAVNGAAECRSQQSETRARAYKESLRDKILPTAAAACTQAREIDGLNGSTAKLVSEFAKLLAGPLGTPDEETAFDLLASNVEVYGAERVKVGFLEFRQKMASDPRVRDPLRLLNGFLKGAKLPKADDPDGKYAAIDRQFARLKREHDKPLEGISYGF